MPWERLAAIIKFAKITAFREPKDSDPQVDLINNGRIGCLIAGKEDCPLTIQFYISPPDRLMMPDLQIPDPSVQAAQVTVGGSDVAHKLQVASALPQPAELDPQGYPAFLPLSEVPHETLPACFLLKLQPAMPVTLPFINKFSQITDVSIPEADLQWAPLPKLLMMLSNSHEEAINEQDGVFTVSLPGGVTHTCVLPGVAWEVPAQRATVMDGIPFTHPAHVPALLQLLRHQCTINTLLRTCVTSRHVRTGAVCGLHFEVLPESETSFSVTFQQPHTNSLAVLLVNISDSRLISCTLFRAGGEEPSLDEYLSEFMTRCMSVPVTLSTLHSELEKTTSAPLSPQRPANAEAENDLSAPPSTSETSTISQSASAPEDGFSISGSACCSISVAKNELLPEINSAAVNHYPFTPVGVFPHWMTNKSQLSELI